MPNGTYGGVRGRKTKEIGGKLRKSFVFLLLDFVAEMQYWTYSSLVFGGLDILGDKILVTD